MTWQMLYWLFKIVYWPLLRNVCHIIWPSDCVFHTLNRASLLYCVKGEICFPAFSCLVLSSTVVKRADRKRGLLKRSSVLRASLYMHLKAYPHPPLPLLYHLTNSVKAQSLTAKSYPSQKKNSNNNKIVQLENLLEDCLSCRKWKHDH